MKRLTKKEVEAILKRLADERDQRELNNQSKVDKNRHERN